MEVFHNTKDTNNFEKASKLKIFKISNYILVIYLNTHCFYGLDLEKNDYTKSFSASKGNEGNNKFLAINIMERLILILFFYY